MKFTGVKRGRDGGNGVKGKKWPLLLTARLAAPVEVCSTEAALSCVCPRTEGVGPPQVGQGLGTPGNSNLPPSLQERLLGGSYGLVEAPVASGF